MKFLRTPSYSSIESGNECGNVILVIPPSICFYLIKREEVAHPTGFEPVTFGIGIQHSIQLSYGCMPDDVTRRPMTWFLA